MSTIPGLGLGIEMVSSQLIEVIDSGCCEGQDYTAVWLRGQRHCGDLSTLIEQPAGILSFLLFYPIVDHPSGGYLVSQHEPGEFISIFRGMEIDENDLAVECAQNAALRQVSINEAKGKGGLIALASETCERLHIPLGAIVMWAEKEEDTEPSFTSFHSLALLPPEQALNTMKFAIWERMKP